MRLARPILAAVVVVASVAGCSASGSRTPNASAPSAGATISIEILANDDGSGTYTPTPSQLTFGLNGRRSMIIEIDATSYNAHSMSFGVNADHIEAVQNEQLFAASNETAISGNTWEMISVTDFRTKKLFVRVVAGEYYVEVQGKRTQVDFTIVPGATPSAATTG